MSTYPIISIVIATYNSEKTLALTLDSIKKQTYPKENIETLIIDGGSTDTTKSIAKEYRCKIIPNPKTDLIFAKQIGFIRAKGKYLIFLDSDEIFENPKSILLKYSVFKKNSHVRAVMLGGYKSPTGYSPINNYINEFGDPFSFFMYRESKGDLFFYREFSKRYRDIIVDEDNKSIIFDFSETKTLPLIELWAGGSMIDLTYVKKEFPFLKKNPELIAHIFYLLNKKKQFLAITRNDNTIHYSCPSIGKYFKKLQSRIKNNIFKTEMGRGGFSGREDYEPLYFKLKKYFFILYAFTFVFPIIDSIYLFQTRKKTIYLLHWYLCLYASAIICYNYFLKFINAPPTLKTYGK
jgi:glycosyltransferase involved in cell wall biosynthesis